MSPPFPLVSPPHRASATLSVHPEFCLRAGAGSLYPAPSVLSRARVHSRPSVYWMERFLEDTTLTVTMPGRLGGPAPPLLCERPPGSGIGQRWPLSQCWHLATLSDGLLLVFWGWATSISPRPLPGFSGRYVRASPSPNSSGVPAISPPSSISQCICPCPPPSRGLIS